jgi:hypothetical protein
MWFQSVLVVKVLLFQVRPVLVHSCILLGLCSPRLRNLGIQWCSHPGKGVLMVWNLLEPSGTLLGSQFDNPGLECCQCIYGTGAVCHPGRHLYRPGVGNLIYLTQQQLIYDMLECLEGQCIVRPHLL